MLIRDLVFERGDCNEYWTVSTILMPHNMRLRITRPDPSNTVHTPDMYWIRPQADPGLLANNLAEHEKMDEFTAQCVLDHYLNNNSLDETHR